MRTPTDAEITNTAVELGLIESGDSVPPRLRAKVAKTIQLATQLDAEDEPTRPTSDAVTLIATTYSDLLEAGIPDHAAVRIAAALAPEIWRTNVGAAHARI
ncbi:hypothetical protein [Rhodococcus sp. AQ5-07]|uniref:hypothetical protein n=1 Tax=Rhodococcus sp. AQ5-07 TaxID=2054902 RepID=UPI000DC02179|nr:hypothetical protein [Rhodococcus sp. AQ5-07]RAL31150.1 hypothetical protein CVN56_29720 [Rhodococcus sp. AQ5-07]